MNNFIFEDHNAIPTSLCNDIINRFENDNHKYNGYVYRGKEKMVVKHAKDSMDLKITGVPEWNNIDILLSKYISQSVKRYFKHLTNKFNGEKLDCIMNFSNYNLNDNGYMISRINKCSKYIWHHDDDLFGVLNFTPMLNVLIYLNTIEESMGGATEFINDRKVQPEVGKILFFPCSWICLHSGQYVRCDKYIVTSRLFV